MPPLRTTSMSAAPKPIKTERTHEENQERAYIAASRRSDRSLEARVESARRASEIHKRRTGRSLRVTEQDVINEEMYEEEDDDLPMQYRRLTAHLQTSNADFDRRLAAYLTNHVAMRQALGQAVGNDNFGQQQQHSQYSNAPQFANNQEQNFGQAMFGNMNNQMNNFNLMAPPQHRSPSMYRQSPYPIPGQQQGIRSMHNRSSSIASPHELQHFPQPQSPVDTRTDDRRMSLPLSGMTPIQGQYQMAPQPQSNNVSPTASRSSSSSNLANLKFEVKQKSAKSQRSPEQKTPQLQQQSPSQNLQPSNFPSAFNMSGMSNMNFANGMDHGIFSTELPMESQQLLGGAFDPNDSMTQMLMGGNVGSQQPFFSYNPSQNAKEYSPSSKPQGMSQTLAPGVLDTNVSSMGYDSSNQSAMSSDTMSPFATSAGGFGGSGFDSFNDAFKSSSYSLSGQTSTAGTPGIERDWQSLIDGHVWEEPSSQQTTV